MFYQIGFSLETSLGHLMLNAPSHILITFRCQNKKNNNLLYYKRCLYLFFLNTVEAA